MPMILIKARDGSQHTIVANGDASLMESIRNAGIDELQAVCGGCASCATCHIYVDIVPDGAELPELSELEDELLEGSFFREANSRLSCQIPLNPSLDGLSVTIPPED